MFSQGNYQLGDEEMLSYWIGTAGCEFNGGQSGCVWRT